MSRGENVPAKRKRRLDVRKTTGRLAEITDKNEDALALSREPPAEPFSPRPPLPSMTWQIHPPASRRLLSLCRNAPAACRRVAASGRQLHRGRRQSTCPTSPSPGPCTASTCLPPDPSSWFLPEVTALGACRSPITPQCGRFGNTGLP